jgi:HSP20 family protein
MMTMRNLAQREHGSQLTPFTEDRGPFSQFRREMDRLFGDVLHATHLPGLSGATAWPTIEVNESDKEVMVTAELPGMKQQDIDLSVENGMLMLSGERKSERGDRGWSERFYGRFERRVALPDGADADHIAATFRDGELVVTIPRADEMRRGRKIPINDETRH